MKKKNDSQHSDVCVFMRQYGDIWKPAKEQVSECDSATFLNIFDIRNKVRIFDKNWTKIIYVTLYRVTNEWSIKKSAHNSKV